MTVALLSGLAFASGAAALLYQTVWLRWFRLLFGSTAYAASATLAAFFLGLAIGSAWLGRRAATTRRPLRAYGWIELATAATAVIVPFVVATYEPLYAALYARLADGRGAFLLVKFGLALAAMLPTTVLLGATLPFLAETPLRRSGALGRDGGLLYATNTAGAVAGSVLGGLWLPERAGLRGTYALAVALSIGVALAALWLGRRDAARLIDDGAVDSTHHGVDSARRSDEPTPGWTGLSALAFGSGFGTIALEVLLMHGLAQILESSIYSFGAVLAVVLASLAIAAAAIVPLARRVAPARLLAGALLTEALLLLALPSQVHLLTAGLAVRMHGSLGNGALLAVLFGAPAFLVAGAVLPLLLHLAGRGGGAALGRLLAANTAGGIAGSLAASFALLETLGLWSAIAVLGLGYGVAALLVDGTPLARARRALVVGIAALAIFSSAASPRRLAVTALAQGERLLAIRQGAHGVVTVTRSEDGNRWLKIDSYYGLASAAASPRQQRWGHLALLHHPDPKRVMFIGSATGGTSAASVLHPVDAIELVEIVPEVSDLAARFFGDVNRNVHRDPRTRVVLEDGRNHVRGTPERYDVIVADLFVPWHPTAGSMYAREHFEAVRSKLAPGGVFAQWLPIYQLDRPRLEIVLATFLDVFPNATLWRGDFSAEAPTAALIATLGDPVPARELEARATALRARGVRDRWLVDPRGLWMLHVGPLAALRGALSQVARTRDDWPVFEFAAGRMTPESVAAFHGEPWNALTESIVAASENDDSAYPGSPAEGPRRGLSMLRANGLALAKTPEAIARARRLQSDVPADLLSPPDATAGEFWSPPPR